MLVDVALFLKWRYIHAENVYRSELELNTNSRHWHVGWYRCFAKHPVSFHDGRTKERQQVLHCSLSGNKAYVGEHPQVLLDFSCCQFGNFRFWVSQSCCYSMRKTWILKQVNFHQKWSPNSRHWALIQLWTELWSKVKSEAWSDYAIWFWIR